MKKTVKVFQVAALLSAVSGASLLVVSAATPAKAAEERLHSSSSKIYGLVAPGEGSKSSANSNSVHGAGSSTSTMSMSSGKTGAGKSGGNPGNEPKIEDPPMPSYDGPNGGGNSVASNGGAGSPSVN